MSLLMLGLFLAVILWHGLRQGKHERGEGPVNPGFVRMVIDLLPTVVLIGLVLATMVTLRVVSAARSTEGLR